MKYPHLPLLMALSISVFISLKLSAQLDAGLLALKNGDYSAAFATLSAQAEKKKTAAVGHFGLALLHSTEGSPHYDLLKANEHGKAGYELLREVTKREDKDELKDIGVSTRELRQIREQISEKAFAEALAERSPEALETVMKEFRFSPDRKEEVKMAYVEAALEKVRGSAGPEEADAALQSYKRELYRYHSPAYGEGEAIVFQKFVSRNGLEAFDAFREAFPDNRFAKDNGAAAFLEIAGSSNIDYFRDFTDKYSYSAFAPIARDSVAVLQQILEEAKAQFAAALDTAAGYKSLARLEEQYKGLLAHRIFQEERGRLEQQLFRAFIGENGWNAFPQFCETHPTNRFVLDNASRAYLSITESESLEKFQAFVKNYPQSHYIEFAEEEIGRLAARRMELSEKAEAALAQSTDAAGLYAFHEKYREELAVYAPAWNEKLDREVLSRSFPDNNFRQFEQFQHSYPNNGFAADKAAVAFTRAAGSGSLSSFESFIRENPSSVFREIAADSVRYWNDYRTAFSREVKEALRAVDTYEEAVALDKKYRQKIARYAPALQEQVDEKLLKIYVDENGGAKLGDFRKAHPDNKHWDEAEVNAFQAVLGSGNLAEYRHFYSNYPNSVFREIVRDSISSLEDRLGPEEKVSFYTLQSRIRKNLQDKDWEAALATVEEAGSSYSGDLDHYNSLLKLLRAPESGIGREPMGDHINSLGSAFSPIVTADGRTLYFCGEGFPGNIGKEDIFVSRKEGGRWSDPEIISELSTAEENESPKSISADGNTLLFFLSGMIAYSRKTSQGWSKPQTYPSTVNIGSWQSDGFLSADGKVLFFIHGDSWGTDKDIYISHKQEDGSWGQAVRLNETINTGKIERSPFLHPDMKTLYFSSAGHGGMGGMDVFVTTRLDDSWENWSEPQNLGKEINTVDDDWGYKVSTDGRKAFFAARIHGSHELFEVDLPEEFRPGQVMAIEGKVEGLASLESATIVVVDSKTKREITRITTEPGTGEYFIVVPKGVAPEIKVEKEGVFSKTFRVDTLGSEKSTVIKNLEVVDFNKEKVEELALSFEDVLFDTDEFSIRETMKGELDELAGILKEKGLKVAISGYTDDVGREDYNMGLSQKRADSVKAYLVAKGCDAAKIIATGYGENNPIAPNETETGRAKNRRVELSFEE